jgi:hypothetical protein
MSKIEVNTVAPQCGTTLTLGESGDTVTLGSGASQSGFGRQGSVNWQTTIKTATFTAASGEGYFCNTGGGAFTVNLPSSPSVGDIVAIKDYGSTFDTNNLTIGRGGSNMNGDANDSVRNTENESLTLVYADATKGWLSVEEGTGFVGNKFITATGGTITNAPCGNYKIHTFTGPGTFTINQLSSTPANNVLEYIVVGGGGSQPGINHNNTPAGGGGAGGFRFASPSLAPATYPAKPLAAPAGLTAVEQSYPVTIGAGGTGGAAGPPAGQAGTPGNTSIFSTITSAAGGMGGYSCTAATAGGSGGGGGAPPHTGGAGNTPPVSPSQGNPGGVNAGHPTNPSPGNPNTGTGGGGGAIGTGANGGTNPGNPNGGGGDGGAGAGVPNFFGTSGQNCGSNYYFAGGGGGGAYTPNPAPNPGGAGGLGGGGTGKRGSDSPNFGTAGTANTGGGGGAPGGACSPTVAKPGSNGGSGIVIIRYKFQ